MTVDVKIEPAEAVYWTTPGDYGLDPAWLYEVEIERVWPDRRTDEGLPISPYTDYARLAFGKQIGIIRHSGGWQLRFECGYGYQQVKVALSEQRDEPNGAQGYPLPGTEPSLIPIPPCDGETNRTEGGG